MYQGLAPKAMTMDVGEATRNKRDEDRAASGYRKRDPSRARLQTGQLAACVADPFWKDAHAASGFEHLEQLSNAASLDAA